MSELKEKKHKGQYPVPTFGIRMGYFENLRK